MPKLSVLMPVYNVAPFVEEAVTSVLNQSFRDFEFLIMDDGSTDETPAILSKMLAQDNRIKLFTRDNRKVASCLNELVTLASGDFVARMDGDDIAAPERFAKQVDYLNQNRDVAVLGCWVDTFGDRHERWHYRQWDNFSRNLLCFGVTILCHPTWMLRREILADYPYDDQFRNIIDREWLARVALNEPNFKFVALPEVLLRYRVHSSSVTGRFQVDQVRKTAAVMERYLVGLGAPLTPSMLSQLMSVTFLQPVSEALIPEVADTLIQVREAIRPRLSDDFGVFREKWIKFCIANQLSPELLDLFPGKDFTYLEEISYQRQRLSLA